MGCCCYGAAQTRCASVPALLNHGEWGEGPVGQDWPSVALRAAAGRWGTGWAAGRPRRAVVGSGSRCPEPCLVPRPVAPAISSQNGGGLVENMAAHGTLRPGRLWGCSLATDTASPWSRLSLRAPGRPARTARESGWVRAAGEPGAPPRGVRHPWGPGEEPGPPPWLLPRCRSPAPAPGLSVVGAGGSAGVGLMGVSS